MKGETNIRDDVIEVLRSAGFEVRDNDGIFAVTGTIDSGAILIEHLMEERRQTEEKFNLMQDQINYLHALVYPRQFADTAAWRFVPMKHASALMALIDPPPMLVDGKMMVFKNPMAADILTMIGAEVRAMFDAVPPTPPEAE